MVCFAPLELEHLVILTLQIAGIAGQKYLLYCPQLTLKARKRQLVEEEKYRINCFCADSDLKRAALNGKKSYVPNPEF